MSLPFYVLNAFTTEVFRGNPAAVVFVDDLQDEGFLQKIAANVNQPVTAFLRRDTAHETMPGTAIFDVRWFTSVAEVPLCGHATIAASGHLFSTADFIASSIDTIHYRSTEGIVIAARKAGEWIALSLPAVQLHEVPEDRKRVLQDITRRALGKEVTVKFAGIGAGSFARRLLVEIDAADDLAGCTPEPAVFLETGHPVNIVTSASTDGDAAFVSRMFAPAVGIPEDHVCGSAHCQLTPYWAEKLAKIDSEMLARQVSVRGGEIRTAWHKAEGTILLSGQSRVIMKGEILL